MLVHHPVAGIAAIAGVAAVLCTAPSLPSVAEDLLPHQAAYHLRLDQAAEGSGIVAGDGVMEYRFDQLCNGWTVENRTFLRLQEEDGESTNSTWTFSSWESLDGRLFRFRAAYVENGQTIERIIGDAKLGAGERGGAARFTRPEPLSIALPPGTVFPTRHIALMIEAARRGETDLSQIVFDGASVDNPYLVYASFGPSDDAEARRIADRAGLPPRPTWWTHLGFFPLSSADGEPEFELAARYREDGVAGAIVQHFRDFSLSVDLSRLELLPPPDC